MTKRLTAEEIEFLSKKIDMSLGAISMASDEKRQLRLNPIVMVHLSENIAAIFSHIEALKEEVKWSKGMLSIVDKSELKQLAEKDQDIEKLRKALEFYTDQGKYGHDDNECSPICKDGGEKAREALK